MLSLKTCIELVYVLEKFSKEEIERIFLIFNLEYYLYPINQRNNSNSKRINILLSNLKSSTLKGPFSGSFQMDLLQYVIDNYYRDKEEVTNKFYDFPTEGKILFEDKFSNNFKKLSNSLKLDGFIIKGNNIIKLLPEEIVETKIDSELIALLTEFNFLTPKGHFEQAVNNHIDGNWAGANSQFRTFIESLLIEIVNILLPSSNCTSASVAIKILSNTINPPFFKKSLNEIESNKCNKPFVEGLWKRLHPEGNHPGLSDEEDSTFRYHLVIVFSHYLLKRLKKRLG
ncbi:hypothetical protein MBM09_01535 [Flaviramulus sp. BrNp1-15]|uniref:hypothetical protein n=1 Tax=Flaviramulus sp. BrNp1-15 TaxID=2916754 RepID=UPI001EE99E11|nr:hypothetical protein [Flaviramulus sp. BrNp1-15]ULC59671.1 hypothetical protein MBM09_01535 [Flaviramulus sp. BrNp1-15]